MSYEGGALGRREWAHASDDELVQDALGNRRALLAQPFGHIAHGPAGLLEHVGHGACEITLRRIASGLCAAGVQIVDELFALVGRHGSGAQAHVHHVVDKFVERHSHVASSNERTRS